MIHWIFDGVPPSGARHGGLAQAEVFTKSLDTFVREVLQNSRDQRVGPDPVRVRFVLEDLSSSDLDDFLASVRWVELEPHLDAIARAGYVTISPRVAEGLESVRARRTLRVLRVEDSGTHGLTGGEDDTESNFNALCRHTLITAGGRRESGGSFGLGKSVLWSFSNLSTVLFSSVPSDAAGRLRFFGRSALAWHRTDGVEWEGSGWLGEREPRPNGERAVSVWDDRAQEWTDGLGISRDRAHTGTSILIVGFDDPAPDLNRSVSDICEEIATSATRWFWPAIEGGDMEITVEGVVENELAYSRQAHRTPEVEPFVRAADRSATVVDRVHEPADVAEREVTLAVPAQRSSTLGARGATQATGLLRLRLSETGEAGLQNSVALVRGTGMVIDYWQPGRGMGVDSPFHAVLLIGTAHGQTPSDHAAEQFLRAAEPPAHTTWVATTERLRGEYERGAATSLRVLFEDVANAVRAMLKEQLADTTEGPEALRRLFPLPSVGGGRPPVEPYRLSNATAYLAGTNWVFGGTFSRSTSSHSKWRVKIGLRLDQETGGPGDYLAINVLRGDAANVVRGSGAGPWELVIEPGVTRFRFDGEADAAATISPSGLGRTRVVLEVRTVVGRDE